MGHLSSNMISIMKDIGLQYHFCTENRNFQFSHTLSVYFCDSPKGLKNFLEVILNRLGGAVSEMGCFVGLSDI